MALTKLKGFWTPHTVVSNLRTTWRRLGSAPVLIALCLESMTVLAETRPRRVASGWLPAALRMISQDVRQATDSRDEHEGLFR